VAQNSAVKRIGIMLLQLTVTAAIPARMTKTLAEQHRDTSSRCELSLPRWDEASPERSTHKKMLLQMSLHCSITALPFLAE